MRLISHGEWTEQYYVLPSVFHVCRENLLLLPIIGTTFAVSSFLTGHISDLLPVSFLASCFFVNHTIKDRSFQKIIICWDQQHSNQHCICLLYEISLEICSFSASVMHLSYWPSLWYISDLVEKLLLGLACRLCSVFTVLTIIQAQQGYYHVSLSSK